MAARRASSTDESDRIFIVNGEDGSMAVYSILVGQNVIAPSKFTTDGEFIAVSVEISNVYAIVKRTINGSPRYTLETFDDTFTTDSASTTTNATIDLPHLRGKTVSIVRDGLVDPDQTLQDSPYRVTFISTPTSTRGAEVGLSYSVTVKTMPSEPVLSSGSVQGFKNVLSRLMLL